jgi:F-type H+-transporting ATPase subunit b
MFVLALQATAGGSGQIEEITRTFGVDWSHFVAQIISFGIVCVILQMLAYKPILRILEARRQQIASGLANARKINEELARIETERRSILARADIDGKRLIEEARSVAALVGRDEIRKANMVAEQILNRAHEAAERDRVNTLAEVKRQIGRLVVHTTAAVTGKILTRDDQRRLVEETTRQLS